MTANTLTDPNVLTCPKCGSLELWDNRLTKKGKQPDYRCKDRACDGAIWLPKPKQTAKPVSQGHPAFLQNAEAQDNAELKAKIGEPDKPKMREAYKALTEWVLSEIAPLYHKHEIGMSPESAAACVQTLFIQASQRGKIE